MTQEQKTDGTILQFLSGSHSFDGVWFGEEHPGYRGKFWWRKFLPSEPSPSMGAEEIKRIAENHLAKSEWLDEKQKQDTTFGFRIGYNAAMQAFTSSRQPGGYSEAELSEIESLIKTAYTSGALNSCSIEEAVFELMKSLTKQGSGTEQ